MRIVLLVAGLAVLAIVLHAMGVGTILAVARRSGWTIVWMILLYALHIAIRGWVIWRSLPQPGLGLIDTLRIRFAAEAVEMLTFTGPFLAEPAKGWMFIRRGIPAATWKRRGGGRVPSSTSRIWSWRPAWRWEGCSCCSRGAPLPAVRRGRSSRWSARWRCSSAASSGRRSPASAC